ncbi:hypothetical protein P691DRAFT_80616 [Macrolepiota fuliginosa MF-IS2]|uniref:Uncharacterized protein n=1 Tax=Macrolepiota fuliginosa MF-IS2 TaxID=1400762 RepID=A0A9P5XMK3_9AGAR|nr:hypothetical protein P691DRAFT_80616 [Macrolepiota fuliginosa MF-IS2]
MNTSEFLNLFASTWLLAKKLLASWFCPIFRGVLSLLQHSTASETPTSNLRHHLPASHGLSLSGLSAPSKREQLHKLLYRTETRICSILTISAVASPPHALRLTEFGPSFPTLLWIGKRSFRTHPNFRPSASSVRLLCGEWTMPALCILLIVPSWNLGKNPCEFELPRLV